MHALIVGETNVGKTALINRVVETLSVSYSGYVTSKDNENYDEQNGYPVYIYEAGKSGVHSSENLIGYCKDRHPKAICETFDSFAGTLRKNSREGDLIVMDEVGNMETCSSSFCDTVIGLLDEEKPIIAAVKHKESEYLNSIKNHPNCKCFYITEENRNSLFFEVLEFMKEQLLINQECKVKINRFTPAGKSSECEATLAEEAEVRLIIDGEKKFEIVCSPCEIKEMCVGRAVCEGIINSVDQISSIDITREEGIIIVNLKVNPEKVSEGENTSFDNRKGNEIKIKPEEVFEMINEAGEYRDAHNRTRSTHSCVLFCNKKAVGCFEDIGRHNAIDKAIGYLYLNDPDCKDCALYFTGRVMSKTVEKIINAGVPVLITKSQPVYEAVIKARNNNVTLICRAWPDSYDDYSCR